MRALLARPKERGIAPVNRSLWVNAAAAAELRSQPSEAARLDQDGWVSASGHIIAYVPDPDGNLICRFDRAEEDFDAPVPDHW